MSGDAECGERLEMRRPLAHCQYADPSTREPTDDRADRDDSNQCRHRPADTAIPATASERPPVGEHRAMGDEIEDPVVRLGAAGEVFAVVVDHLVGAQRPHEVELAGVVDSGHVGTCPLRQLDRERARATARPVDEDPHPWRYIGGSLQCDRCRLWDRRRLAERQLLRLGGEGRFGRNGVLGEAAFQPEVVAVHLVTRLEPGDVGADGLDSPGDVRAERRASRRSKSSDAGVERRAAQAFPVAQVERRRGNPHEHLVGARHRRRHVVDPKQLGRAVAVVDDGPHTGPRSDRRTACRSMFSNSFTPSSLADSSTDEPTVGVYRWGPRSRPEPTESTEVSTMAFSRLMIVARESRASASMRCTTTRMRRDAGLMAAYENLPSLPLPADRMWSSIGVVCGPRATWWLPVPGLRGNVWWRPGCGETERQSPRR
jgi:hypothetical protein